VEGRTDLVRTIDRYQLGGTPPDDETVLKIDSLSRDSAYFEVINVRSTTDTCELARLLAA